FRLPLEHPPAQSPITAQGESKMGGANPDGVDVLFSGDLLFAGSIGRTDLPGGAYPTIVRTLAQVCLPLPDQTGVRPGHGPQTTIGAERRTNPFLGGLNPPGPGPARGM